MTNHAVDKRIEAAFAREDWPKARDLLIAELKKDPRNHWLLARLSTTFYEERKYKKALTLIEQAYEIAPHCPLVNWDYAGTLDALGKSKKALRIYCNLIAKGPAKLADMEPCGEGLDWALSLLIDCIFRGGVCLEHLGQNEKAIRWFQAFLKLRAEKDGGLYEPEDALKRITKLSSQRRDSTGVDFEEVTRDLLEASAQN